MMLPLVTESNVDMQFSSVVFPLAAGSHRCRQIPPRPTENADLIQRLGQAIFVAIIFFKIGYLQNFSHGCLPVTAWIGLRRIAQAAAYDLILEGCGCHCHKDGLQQPYIFVKEG